MVATVGRKGREMGDSMDRCRATFLRDEVTLFGIEGLLTKGQIQIECIDPACEESSWFSSYRHRFQVSLYDLIEVYIRGES